MILRDLVGGGGRAKASFCCCWAADERRRAFTVSLGWRYGDTDDVFVPELDGRRGASLLVMAEGGSSNVICNEDSLLEWSWPLISVEEAGVGGIFGRVIVRVK
jgi:hypothetical protein